MKALVIGGGISGIAAASSLSERGCEVQILEAAGTLGGRIGTREHEGDVLDLGGRNFSSGETNLLALLTWLGIGELVDYNFNSVCVGPVKRFDHRRGGSPIKRAARAMGNVARFGPMPLLRLRRIANEASRDPAGDVVGGPYWVKLAEATDDPSAVSYFGRDVAESVIRPWTLRMMASEPEEVHLGNLGPLLGKKPGSFKRVANGMQTFTRAAEKKLPVRLQCKVERVKLEGGRVQGVEGLDAEGKAFSERADIVVVATPALAAGDILSSAPDLAARLKGVTYRPVATVVARYGSVEFPGGVSGLFMPRGCVSSHIAKYDHDNRVRFSFAGAAARPVIARASVEEILSIGEGIFREFGGKLGARESFTGNVWLPGLCLHGRMHHQTTEALRKGCDALRGLALAGDYIRGNSLEACIISARESVERAFSRASAS